MNPALDFHGIGIEAVAGIDIADPADGLPGNFLVVDNRFRGNLAADDAEVCGDHRLAGHPGVRVLGKAGIQNRVGDGVGDLVGVPVGDALGSKQSFFHNNSFLFSQCTVILRIIMR